MQEDLKKIAKAPNLLEQTLAASKLDDVTVTKSGESLAPTTYGSVSHNTKTHVDDRGEVTELIDTRWDWHPDPINFAYTYTIRPGYAKGWGLHKQHEDRYFLIEGRMEMVLYDVRADSPTYGKISKIILSKENPRIVSIPRFVWHANANIGEGEVRVINFPTQPYEHANPDKYRLPLNTPHIPYTFKGVKGG
ncbi:MAG: dTDP-4-dehydrorhamnose 3,5-epimerase family protein [Rhodobacteraceae bacterium]|nr:dTDP-4-dehydrorhamnose 3,5-epimerase family protein [Paracoccaceae bacterium]